MLRHAAPISKECPLSIYVDYCKDILSILGQSQLLGAKIKE